MKNMEYNMKFAKELRRILAERNITQKELAEAIGIAAGTVSRYAAGLRTPSGYTASKITEYLGLPWDYFFKLKEN